MEALDEPRGDDADDALVPVLAREDVAAAARSRSRQRLDERDRLPQDAVLDRLALAIQLLELGREPLAPVRVVGEDELERDVGAARAGPRR